MALNSGQLTIATEVPLVLSCSASPMAGRRWPRLPIRAAIVACTLAGQVLAQTSPPTEPAVTAPARGDNPHVHDGFYLRAELATGRLGGKPWTSINGLHNQASLRLGFSPVSGVVVGGGIATGITFIEEGSEADGELGLSANENAEVHLFVSYYPEPQRGLCFMGSLGRAKLWLNDDEGQRIEAAIGLAAGVGYDFWIARYWSIGPALSVSHYLAHESRWSEVTETETLYQLAFAATLH